MLGKVLGSFLAGILVVVVALQVSGVNAIGKNGPISGPVTGPITSSSDCKPGWGYGDKNHCHAGPPGLIKKEASDSSSQTNSVNNNKPENKGKNKNNN